jgi:hypothetical protein
MNARQALFVGGAFLRGVAEFLALRRARWCEARLVRRL